MDSSTEYVYTRISTMLFEKLRDDAGPFGPSVNQMVQEMLDYALQCQGRWVATIAQVSKSTSHIPVGVKVTRSQMENLKQRQLMLKSLGYNVQISDIINGLYLQSVQAEEELESWVQLVNLAFPKSPHLVKVYVLKEDELSLVKR